MSYKVIGAAVALVALFAGCKLNASDELEQNRQENVEQAAGKPSLYRGVTHEEYSASDPDMRRLIDE